MSCLGFEFFELPGDESREPTFIRKKGVASRGSWFRVFGLGV